jgi:putative SOS response-associated peptidase YedK
VAPIHPKDMPLLLTVPEVIEMWMTAAWKEAKSLQRPLPEDRLILLPAKRDLPLKIRGYQHLCNHGTVSLSADQPSPSAL